MQILEKIKESLPPRKELWSLVKSLFLSFLDLFRPRAQTTSYYRERVRVLANACKLFINVNRVHSGIYHGKEVDGDSLLFAGLVSSVSELGRLTVNRAQGPDGRMWRSPARVGKEVEDAFSRDQLLGFLIALSSQSVSSAKFTAFMEYLRKNKYKLNPISSDGRNELRLTTKAALYRTAKEVQAAGEVPSHWYLYTWIDKLGHVASAAFSKLGYRVHLAVVNAYLNHVQVEDSFLDSLIFKIAHRRDPKNPLYFYLAHGCTQELMNYLEGEFQRAKEGLGKTPSRYWAWERDFAQDPLAAPLFWDYFFLFSLIQKGTMDVD